MKKDFENHRRKYKKTSQTPRKLQMRRSLIHKHGTIRGSHWYCEKKHENGEVCGAKVSIKVHTQSILIEVNYHIIDYLERRMGWGGSSNSRP